MPVSTVNTKNSIFLFTGETVLHHTFMPFVKIGLFESFCVTIPRGFQKETEHALGKRMVHHLGERLIITEGGETRQESVFRGLKALKSLSPDIVLIHDGARPRIAPGIISSVYETVLDYGAAAPIIPSVDAMKIINNDGIIQSHLDRPSTVGIQTPQGFTFTEILEAYTLAENDGHKYIDDSEIYHRYKGKVYTVPGDLENTKITYFSDIRPEEGRI